PPVQSPDPVWVGALLVPAAPGAERVPCPARARIPSTPTETRRHRRQARPDQKEHPVAQIAITLDEAQQRIEEGTTGTELFEGRSEIIALRIDGELRDLSERLADGQHVEGVDIASEDALSILPHRVAQCRRVAVPKVDPEANRCCGPPITDGCCYDFAVA